jgi:DNA polymerase III sliding clamp (beta) subunit (PCNA family)
VRRDETGTHDLSVLKVEDDGTVALCSDGDDRADSGQGHIAVNRAFLLDALAAGGRDRLVLEVTSPTAPIAIRRPDDEDGFSVLMPVRLED